MAVTNKYKEYNRFAPMWKKCRDFVAGEEQVKSGGELYLPRPSGMEKEDYESYKNRAEFYNAVCRTLDGLHGLMFRKNPIFENADNYDKFFENVDGKGNSAIKFINDTSWDCLQVGFGGVLVDAPANSGEYSMLEAEFYDTTPYVTYYPAETIINKQFETVGRKQLLIRVVLEETYTKETVDKFTLEEKKRYRVCELDEKGYYCQTVYDEDSNVLQETVYPKKNGKIMTHIPFYFLPSTSPEKPMLMDLVNVNNAWYRKSADLENGAHWTGVPTPYVIGYEPETKFDPDTGKEIPAEPIKLGGAKLLAFPMGVTAVSYLEFGGSGLNTLITMLATDEERMAVLGARIISQEKRGVESAETARIHRAGENSVLATFSHTMSIAFSKIFTELIEWSTNSDKLDIKVEINTDYDVVGLTSSELIAIVSCWQSGGIAKSDLFKYLKKGEIIESDRKFEEMQAEIEEEQLAKSIRTLQGE